MTVPFAPEQYTRSDSDHELREAVLGKVTGLFGVSRAELAHNTRIPKVLIPRMVAMWLLRKHTKMSTPSIGRAFGNRDHTTVLNAIASVSQRMRKDAAFAKYVADISASIPRRRIEAGVDAATLVPQRKPPHHKRAYERRAIVAPIEAIAD